jgi:uncharacterized protein
VQYRKLGKMDWEVSVLGLGSMSLPILAGQPAKIDQAETTKIVRYLIDRGVNYLDLGLPLDPQRHEQSVRALGQALSGGYREKVRLALPVPVLKVDSGAQMEHYLDKHLEWLETDRVDFLLPGWLDRATWPRWLESGGLEWAEKALASGKTANLGFAFHDQYQYLKEIMSAFDRWSLVQFQYSFMDVDHHPGVSGLKYAADNGMGVVASQPLCGGRLTHPPSKIAELWSDTPYTVYTRPLYQWALSWVWNHTEVSTAVVDIRTMQQAEEDVALADQARADVLSVQEEVLISRVRDAYRKLKAFPCTACRSCMPCPQGIDAPRIFELYNEALMFGGEEIPRSLYLYEGHSVEACNECGACEKLCGRGIKIAQQLGAADKLLRRK